MVSVNVSARGRYGQRGMALIGVIVTIVILAFVLLRSSGLAETRAMRQEARTKGAGVADVVRSWESAMTYLCVSGGGAPASLALSDLTLPAARHGYAYVALNYAAPPNPSIRVRATIGVAGAPYALGEFQRLVQKAHLASTVTAVIEGGDLVVEAGRLTSSSTSVMYQQRASADASRTSVMIGGTQVFDANGC